MNLKKLLLTENECYKVGKTITVKGIMVHSTGANNPDLKRYVGPDDGKLGFNSNKNHWNQFRPGGKRKCVHAFIGKLANGSIATYQTLPWDMRGWHAGGSANDTHIGFEICEDTLNDSTYFNKVYKEAVELCAHLCKLYKLDPISDGVIICHSEGYSRGVASGHGDVLHWFPKHGKSMDDFRKDVAKLIKNPSSKPSVSSSKSNKNKHYLVRVNTLNLNVRKGPGVSYNVTTTIRLNEVYTIVEENNGWGKLKSGAGWINLNYTKKL